jgi:hypothetical protein
LKKLKKKKTKTPLSNNQSLPTHWLHIKALARDHLIVSVTDNNKLRGLITKLKLLLYPITLCLACPDREVAKKKGGISQSYLINIAGLRFRKFMNTASSLVRYIIQYIVFFSFLFKMGERERVVGGIIELRLSLIVR